MRTRLLSLGLALILILAACGGEDDTTDNDAEGSDEVGTEARPEDGGSEAPDAAGGEGGGDLPADACSLVSDATAADIAPEASSSASDGLYEGDLGDTVGCRWDDGDFIYPLEIGVVANPEAYEYDRELVTELGGYEVEEITGVGDEAFTFDEESGVLEVNARQGDLVIKVRVRTDSAAVPIAVANEVLLNL